METDSSGGNSLSEIKWVFHFAISLHLAWAVAVLADERAAWTTSLNAIYQLCGGSAYGTALLLVVVSVLAVWAMRARAARLSSLLMLMGQQALLVISAYGALTAAMSSSFADGVKRPFWFIFADQFPTVLVCLVHTGAFLEFSKGVMFSDLSELHGHG